MMLTIRELEYQVERAGDEVERARWKTALRDDFVRWAKMNKRKEQDPQALKEWKAGPAKSVLIIKCKI